jgi:hypothetical protein
MVAWEDRPASTSTDMSGGAGMRLYQSVWRSRTDVQDMGRVRLGGGFVSLPEPQHNKIRLEPRGSAVVAHQDPASDS